jgi:prepilin-type N-terminal cleavage/methylation domain-containing protein
MRKAGFSLLEVILALAILAGSIAMLGEANQMALKNAEVARDLAHAQLLCESKMSEIVTGITSTDSVSNAQFDATMTDSLNPSEAGWLYSIESQTPDKQGLLTVRVTVTRNLPAAQHPVSFTLVRWLRDPDSTTSSSGTSTTSGS